MYFGAVQCSVVQCSAVWCSAVQRSFKVGDESVVLESVLCWLAKGGERMEQRDEQGDEQGERLLAAIRFPLLSRDMLARVEVEERYRLVRESQAYRSHREAGLADHLSSRRRCRGTSDILVVHHDGSHLLHAYNTADSSWAEVAEIPPGTGGEYSALAAAGSRLYLVGGRSREGVSLRAVWCLDFEDMTWSRLEDMREVRWYHGAVVINNRLYAVAGCGQLDSVEYLELGAGEGWQPVCQLARPRHMPGVGSKKSVVSSQ